MEKVFWLMYLADVVTNVSIFAGVITLFCLVAFIFIAVVATLNDSVSFSPNAKYLWWLVVPAALAVGLPSPTTIRLLAIGVASEAAISTQLGQKGLEALNAVLDEVIIKAKRSAK